ncbi:uncharacterized protein LOC130708804 [Balaenoptera acutorostrata]|uniref:Uncharacterized protein LOC130708804 n=1 Tax=Balaenoptera acutorostrata TaxID=9767 RepID=A0ABM3U1V1_BALAC|nr:uncharacterized protein LOC130708804 [Balaenoptera acutorostrata]
MRTEGCGPSQRLPGNQSPLIFLRPPSGLHPGPADQRDQPEAREEEGPGLLAMLEAVSFFFHHSSRLRNVPKLGAGNPGLLSSLNPAVTPGTRWRWTELQRVTQSLRGSSPFSLLRGDADLVTSSPLFGGRWGRPVLAAMTFTCRLLIRNGAAVLPNHGDPKSQVKVKTISPPFPTTLPQEAQMPPSKPVKRCISGSWGANEAQHSKDESSRSLAAEVRGGHFLATPAWW